jgi:hypothetical protein
MPLKFVQMVYNSYWSFVREYASSLPLKEITEDELDTLTTNFNVPYIGKLYVNGDKVRKYINQLNYYRNVKTKEIEASRLSGTCD